MIDILIDGLVWQFDDVVQHCFYGQTVVALLVKFEGCLAFDYQVIFWALVFVDLQDHVLQSFVGTFLFR